MERVWLFWFVAVLSMVPANAHAYIDPSAGQSLLQIIIAAVAAGGIFFRFCFKHIAKIFTRNADNSKNSLHDR